MKNVRVSENVKICFKHPYCGRVTFPIDKVERTTERAFDLGEWERVVVFFTQNDSTFHKGDEMKLEIQCAMRLIAKHMKEQNDYAEQHAIERGFTERLDRYVVKDMCVEEIWFVDGGVQLYCTWEDFVGSKRGYRSEVCAVHSAYKDETTLYLSHRPPTFYF